MTIASVSSRVRLSWSNISVVRDERLGLRVYPELSQDGIDRSATAELVRSIADHHGESRILCLAPAFPHCGGNVEVVDPCEFECRVERHAAVLLVGCVAVSLLTVKAKHVQLAIAIRDESRTSKHLPHVEFAAVAMAAQRRDGTLVFC